jgi:hypothetical protein
MVGVGIVALTVGLSLWIFILEFVILGIFALYWIVQSFELRSQITKDEPSGDADAIDHLGLRYPAQSDPGPPYRL